MAVFKVVSDFEPAGDQPNAIKAIVNELNSDVKNLTLLGITGSGKTFTMAKVIEELQRPALILSHNKVLAAQLYGEFKALFPKNAVEFFISYYDYYQPEAYMPITDTFIEKDMSLNEEIDRLRLRATASLLSRKDVIIVSSVSCIYGIGSPDEYGRMMVLINNNHTYIIKDILKKYDSEQINLFLEESPKIDIRPNSMKRCLTNLIDNALAYGQRTEIFTKSMMNNIIIFIDDDGPGIPKNEYQNVLKPFYRIDKSRGQNKSGVGLGLSIANDIIHSHGGNISLEKSPLNGLRVKVSLPF